jgi:hypothetical protein
MRIRRLYALAVLALLLVPSTLPPTRAHAAGCPTSVRFEPAATGATLDAGWQGFLHDQPIFGTTLDLAIDCPANLSPCGICAITGLAADPPDRRLRCRDDTSIECTVATEVADCGAHGSCGYFVTPPQPLAAGGLPFCATTRVSGVSGGTVGVESGAFAPTLSLQTLLYDGAVVDLTGGPNRGCPRCLNDAVANDGVRGGTCDVGPRAGAACDAHGLSPIADFGSPSFDCPPAGPDITQFNLNGVTLSTTPQTVTLSAASPACTGFDGLRCFCATCNDVAAERCFSDADCPPSGGNPGVCGGRRCLGGPNSGAPCSATSECPGGGPAACGQPGTPLRPNPCFDDTMTGTPCTPSGDGGVCGAGPFVVRCSNHPNRGCDQDADCDGVVGSCNAAPRACFPDNGLVGGSVSAIGTATPPIGGIADPTALGFFTCFGPSPDVFVQVWGLPGLARYQQPGRLIFPEIAAASPCPPAPANDCRPPTVAGKSVVQLTDRTANDKDRLGWKWSAGTATVADFGDPVATDDYALCIYDGAERRLALGIPAGGTCGGKPCWRRKSTGFVYRDGAARPDGITVLTLRAGIDGKAQIQAKGRGALLAVPPLAGFTSTVRVQLRDRASGLCWESRHVPPFDKQTPEQLKDKSD